MQINEENIILFPKWKESLEQESLIALQAKRYEEALEKLNVLLEYQVDNHEVLIGKLMCLIELGRFDEALDLSEDLLAKKEENYYHYAHIYLTILFQTNQYQALIERVKYELEDPMIPEPISEQFQQLYQMSKEMNQDLLQKQANEYIEELTIAMTEQHYERQWQLVESLRRMDVKPTEEMIHYLVDDLVHPVIKTSIFKWLQAQKVSQVVEVHKNNDDILVKPSDIPNIREHHVIKEIMLTLSDLEQGNPSLYILLEQLLYRYAYVKFPIMPSHSDVFLLAQALRNIGEEYLHKRVEESIHDEVFEYIKDIKMCEALYLSVIAE